MARGAPAREVCFAALKRVFGLGETLAKTLVGLALGSGARVVLVNRGETPYDEAATLRVWTGHR